MRPGTCARALTLAGHVLELGGKAAAGEGLALARATLESGAALRKFEAICAAQGGMREPEVGALRHDVLARRAGYVAAIDNRRLARVAKLAGAPRDAGAGVLFLAPVGRTVKAGEPLYTIHAASAGTLSEAVAYAATHPDIIAIVEEE